MRRVLVVAALLALSMPARADIYVTISKSQQQMAVAIDGAGSYRWPVSTGRPGYTTPSGSFRAIRLERVYYSKKYDDAPMPNAVFFYGGYAIHGTFEESRLGRPVSHGCVRLHRANAEVLFEAVRQQGMNHTHIVITDAPLDGGMPVARLDRGFDVSRSYERSLETRPAYERRSGPRSTIYERTFAPQPARERGFEQFGGWREPERTALRPAWRDSDHDRRRVHELVSGRTYSEAEMRRIFRDNGWRWEE